MERKILIKNGLIVSMDDQIKNLPKGDILITDNKIEEVGASIEVEDAQVIDANGMIVMPGFVDAHRHLWETNVRGIASDLAFVEYLGTVLGKIAPQYQPDDVYVGNLLGALECINAGITTVFDWSHIMNSMEHTEAAIAGLRDSGIRGVFGYGTPGTSVWKWFYESKLTHPQNVEKLKLGHFSSQEGNLSLALCIRGPEYSTLEVTTADIAYARENNIPVSMHVGCGTFYKRYDAITKLHKNNLLGPDLNFAHGNFLQAADLKILADYGCSISVTPEIEMQMGLGFPITGEALRNGLLPSLGIDVISACGGDMFSQMKIALQTDRALINNQHIQNDTMPEKVSITCYDILKASTINGAKAVGLDHRTGSITKGKQADIILLSQENINMKPVSNVYSTIVLQSSLADIDTVLVGGKVVKRSGKLLHDKLATLYNKLELSHSRLMSMLQ